MAPHLLEFTGNRVGNGRPDAELDPGITMRFLSWRGGLTVTDEVTANVVMPANAGIHGGERRNLAIGRAGRAKALDPSPGSPRGSRGDDRRGCPAGRLGSH